MKDTQNLFNATTKARDLLASRIKDIEVAMKIQDREINRLRMENEDLRNGVDLPEYDKDARWNKFEGKVFWFLIGVSVGLVASGFIYKAALDATIG